MQRHHNVSIQRKLKWIQFTLYTVFFIHFVVCCKLPSDSTYKCHYFLFNLQVYYCSLLVVCERFFELLFSFHCEFLLYITLSFYLSEQSSNNFPFHLLKQHCLCECQEATVFECELILRYGVEFDKVATTRLIASGFWFSGFFAIN